MKEITELVEVEKNRTFKMSAVRKDSGKLYAFGISAATSSLYGYEDSDIIDVELEIDEDQSDKPYNETGYWGWYDKRQDRIASFIQDSYLKLWICFPNGITIAEELGEGRAYRLREKI